MKDFSQFYVKREDGHKIVQILILIKYHTLYMKISYHYCDSQVS